MVAFRRIIRKLKYCRTAGIAEGKSGDGVDGLGDGIIKVNADGYQEDKNKGLLSHEFRCLKNRIFNFRLLRII
jgi:hypothetical protein